MRCYPKDYSSGRNPPMALRLLDDLSLFPLVFHIPPAIASTLSSQPSWPSLALAAASILQTFLRPDAALFQHPPIHPLILSGLSSSTTVVPRLYMACALTPYRGITYVDEKGKVHPAVEAVIRAGLKVGTKTTIWMAFPLCSPPLSYSSHRILKTKRSSLLLNVSQ